MPQSPATKHLQSIKGLPLPPSMLELQAAGWLLTYQGTHALVMEHQDHDYKLSITAPSSYWVMRITGGISDIEVEFSQAGDAIEIAAEWLKLLLQIENDFTIQLNSFSLLIADKKIRNVIEITPDETEIKTASGLELSLPYALFNIEFESIPLVIAYMTTMAELGTTISQKAIEYTQSELKKHKDIQQAQIKLDLYFQS